MKKILAILLTSVVLAVLLASPAVAAQAMTRTLKDKPTIVLTAFGTSTRAQVTYDVLEKQVREALPDYDIRWAFTSEVIRERVNNRWASAGKKERLLSLQQALANAEAEGFRKAVVQPIHIFPGEEYEEVMAAVENFPGLTIETGESLLQRWETIHEVVHLISADFLPPEEGSNVIVAHGTPSTNVGSNITYLGLDRYLNKRFDNVVLGAVEGIITPADALDAAKAYDKKRVRFIPLMYVAGDHIMNDIMGEDEEADEPSWKTQLEKAGLKTDVKMVKQGKESYYKGLGFFSGVNEIFINEIKRAIERL